MNAGLQGRFHLGSVLLNPRLGYGRQRLDFSAAATGTAQQHAPQIDYQYVSPGVQARVILGAFSLLAGCEYRHFLSRGRVGDIYFPEANLFGFEFHGGASIRTLEWLDFQLLAIYERISYDLNARANAPFQGSTAVDQYQSFNLSMVAHF
ncbi:MAG: hypothetical protein R3C68_10515 [Myxococcota bacterium]